MGNFYTNVTVKAEPTAVAEILRAHRRDAFVAAAPGGMTVVVDREADTQDIDTLASLALTLAAKLSAPALAVLNHDDDALLLALYDPTGLVMEHGWSNGPPFDVPRTDRSAFVEQVRARFGTGRRAPVRHAPVPGGFRELLAGLLGLAFGRFFAIDRHKRLVEETGLPDVCIGAGYNYVARGDVIGGAQQFTRV